MSQADRLAEFVGNALSAGHDRTAINDVLTRSGWTEDERVAALGAFADEVFAPPVPRPRAVVSARDFFVYVLMFGALMATASYLVVLLHGMIDLMWETFRPYRMSSLRWAVAVLIVMAPAYLWLNHREEKRVAREPGRSRSALRKWVTYVTMLVAAVVFSSDLVWVLYRLLEGDLTLQFGLKALVVAVVAAWVFVVHLRRVEDGI